WNRVLNSFCGINGMCLGVSFFMFFSMLDVILQALWSCCRSRCDRHRSHQTSAASSLNPYHT
ncbi:hypothetical protein MTO96_037563, partial [Rhipicephalus appendiculatus]